MQFITLSLTALLGAVSFFAPTTVAVDPAASTVEWTGYKVTGSHEGTIAVKSGELTMTDGKLTGGQFVIDMTTIAVTDLTADQGGDKLRGHLTSDDFFGIAKHPTAKMVITNVKPKMAGQYTITGNLTIKDKTNPVTFDATVYQANGKTVATGSMKVDRSKYDVKYGSGSFFDDLGDKTIYDEFDLAIKLVSK